IEVGVTFGKDLKVSEALNAFDPGFYYGDLLFMCYHILPARFPWRAKIPWSVVFYSDDMLDCDGVFSQCIVSSVDDYLGGAALGVVNVFVARSGDDGVRCPDVDVRSVEPSMVDWGDS
nr:hypothetical protein [Tanacetum cinerariifolium]